MHPRIATWPSQEFYRGEVSSHSSTRNRPFIPGFPSESEEAMAFIHVQGREKREANSYSNEQEAEVVCEVLNKVLAIQGPGHVAVDTVGIITPYDAQTNLLRKHIPHDVLIASVDAFQSQEKDLIALSTVRSCGQGIGFGSDDRRLNVAITRAKRGLLVIGNYLTFKHFRL